MLCVVVDAKAKSLRGVLGNLFSYELGVLESINSFAMTVSWAWFCAISQQQNKNTRPLGVEHEKKGKGERGREFDQRRPTRLEIGPRLIKLAHLFCSDRQLEMRGWGSWTCFELVVEKGSRVCPAEARSALKALLLAPE